MSPGDAPAMEGLRSQVEHRKNGRRLMNHHIQATVRQADSLGDDLDLYLSLYSPKAGAYVSERALVPRPAAAKKSYKRDMVFMDVGNLDECRELHLVCHVFRMGRMAAPLPGPFILYEGRKSSIMPAGISGTGGGAAAFFKRPHAVGVVNINKLVTRP